MKLCIDCAHCRWRGTTISSQFERLPSDARCVNPIVAKISPVDGSQQVRYCDYMRQTECGPEARLFEQKREAA